MSTHQAGAERSASSTNSGAVVPFDRTGLRVNQAAIVTLLAVAFVLNLPALVLAVALVMALGTALPQAALFLQLYRHLLRPAGLLRPDVQSEDPTPHRFAQGMGASVLLLASLALWSGAVLLGWGLTLLVVALAAINLVWGFCAGCFVFFQLQRLRGAR